MNTFEIDTFARRDTVSRGKCNGQGGIKKWLPSPRWIFNTPFGRGGYGCVLRQRCQLAISLEEGTLRDSLMRLFTTLFLVKLTHLWAPDDLADTFSNNVSISQRKSNTIKTAWNQWVKLEMCLILTIDEYYAWPRSRPYNFLKIWVSL